MTKLRLSPLHFVRSCCRREFIIK